MQKRGRGHRRKACRKTSLFISARKRGISPEMVRAALGALGLPPTNAEREARQITTVVPRPSWDGGDYLRTTRDPTDRRELTQEQADMVRRYLGM